MAHEIADKDDSGKAPWHLFPWDAARQIVAVLRFGAGKYGDRNWERGIAYSRVYSALIRHLVAWWEGEPATRKRGSHTSPTPAAACCFCSPSRRAGCGGLTIGRGARS